MTLSTTAELHTILDSVNAEGAAVRVFIKNAIIDCDIQPAALTQTEAAAFGLSDVASNAKRMYLRNGVTLKIGERIVHGGNKYEIRAVNVWRIHTEAILIPIIGAARNGA